MFFSCKIIIPEAPVVFEFGLNSLNIQSTAGLLACLHIFTFSKTRRAYLC